MSNDTQEPEVTLTVKLKLKSRPVNIEDADGTVKAYTINEMVGSDRDAWMNFLSARTKTNDQGDAVGVKDFDKMQATLIEKCLKDAAGNKVGMGTLARWPAEALDALFKACQQINGLDGASAEKEKNS